MEVDFNAINDVTSFWDESEKIIKVAENIQYAMVVPAISELRYAGRRLIDYLWAVQKELGETAAREAIEDFKQCCIRARHDAVDTTVAYIDEYMSQISQSVGLAIVAEYAPDFQKLRPLVTKMSNDISVSRADRLRRIDIYNKLIDTKDGLSEFDKMIEIFQKVRDSEQLMEASKMRQERNRTIYKAAVAFGFAGTSLFAISTFFLLKEVF